MRKVFGMIVLMLGFAGSPVWAVAPQDTGRDCESENGRFIDKNGDENSDIFDWREMTDEEKNAQIVWSLETLCKEAEAPLVNGIIDAMNRLAGIEEGSQAAQEG